MPRGPVQARQPRLRYLAADQWPWFSQLAARGYLITAVHRSKNLIVSPEVARLLDPICRAEMARMRAADPGWRRLLDHLAAAGPASAEDLPHELMMKRQDVKALRAPMERCGAIVSRSLHVTGGDDQPHTSEITRWDKVYPAGIDRDPREALRDLVGAGVRAAVIAPERELRRWFSWRWYWTDSLVDDLVREGGASRVNGHVTAPEF